MQPICVQCGRQMKCEKNGFKIEQFKDIEKTEPYRKFNADKYKCPECGIEIIIDVASEPLVDHLDKDYDEVKTALKFY